MAIHLTPEANPTVQEGTLYVDSATGEFNVAGRTTPHIIPHIIPGVLYPAVAGKLLDGSTSHSGNYGTAQSDGRSYYYTDIKGSKPIKDPRIGGHFGSQRHKFKSLQLLEQETATHGSNVYSVDGREWCRVWATSGDWVTANQSRGTLIQHANTSGGQYLEFVGYFNQINIITETGTAQFNSVAVHIDGVSKGTDLGNNKTSVSTPLGTRYVDSGSVQNIAFTAISLGLHTCKITFEDESGDDDLSLFGIELIAQDTSNRSNIQIPSQNVVSYGKKFNVSAEGSSGHHYDPFNGFTSGNLASVQALGIDTDTSLGLSKWLPSDAGTTYYRPFNGGRVIKWVDSSGVIKTSVNMMPPNAKSIAGTNNPTNAFAERTTASHFGTNNAMNSFEAGTDLDSDQLSEVAKTFHFREFGNGAANSAGGGGTSNTYADASMLSATADNIGYVMDDGTTSLSATSVAFKSSKDLGPDNANDTYFITFIGTGISKTSDVYSTNYTIAQNLPYGTHVLKIDRQDDNGGDPDITIDGVAFTPNTNDYGYSNEITFHQPKKPPIPEDACVIADYMLMADFVPQTAHGGQYISKGTRMCTNARDIFVDRSSGAVTFNQDPASVSTGFRVYPSTNAGSNTEFKVRLPAFATNYVVRGRYMNDRALLYIGDSTTTSTYDDNDVYGSYAHLTNDENLGVQNWGMNSKSGKQAILEAFCFATPIHTSSHYQSFETPFLHELVGGDRNMEQTNLVCSPDGKSWDELTRDTSYMGGLGINTDASSNQNTVQNLLFSEWRGKIQGASFYNKGFAIAYDRVICLIPGRYRFFYSTHADSGVSGGWSEIRVNGLEAVAYYTWGTNYTNPVAECVVDLVRGDYVQVFGNAKADLDCQSVFNIQQV